MCQPGYTRLAGPSWSLEPPPALSPLLPALSLPLAFPGRVRHSYVRSRRHCLGKGQTVSSWTSAQSLEKCHDDVPAVFRKEAGGARGHAPAHSPWYWPVCVCLSVRSCVCGACECASPCCVASLVSRMRVHVRACVTRGTCRTHANPHLAPRRTHLAKSNNNYQIIFTDRLRTETVLTARFLWAGYLRGARGRREAMATPGCRVMIFVRTRVHARERAPTRARPPARIPSPDRSDRCCAYKHKKNGKEEEDPCTFAVVRRLTRAAGALTPKP
jgi:hypothetical protein